jgi:hypothetical protein
MVTFVNRARMSTSTTGTGTITLGSASSGFQSFADAGITDGQTVRYVIEDGTDFEIGTGTYTASGTTMSRSVEESSNSDAALNLSGSAIVYVTVAATDVLNKAGDTMSGDLLFSGTGQIDLPAGSTAQRSGSPSNGMLRYNTDDNAFEGYANGAWGAIGGGGGDTQTVTTSSTTETTLATYAKATYVAAEIVVVADDGTNRTIAKLLVTHDGTTAVATQFGEVNTSTQLATYNVDISGTDVRLRVTAASATSTDHTAIATLIE